MSFHEDELLKIKRATSGFFKRNARAVVAASLIELRAKIEAANRLNAKEREAELRRLVNEATTARQAAVRSGANSHGHPRWAAAAACESWLQELILGEADDIRRVAALVSELSES